MPITVTFFEIPAIIGVKSNITTFNYVCRFIVNIFYCGKIIFNGFNHADIKGVKQVPWENNWPPWPHGDQNGHSQPWLSRDWAVTEPWSYWRCRDWAVTSPWLSCDLAVTELWPGRDWAVTSPSRDWAVIIWPGAVTTVVTVSSRWAHSELHRELTVTIFFSWKGITSAASLDNRYCEAIIPIIRGPCDITMGVACEMALTSSTIFVLYNVY